MNRLTVLVAALALGFFAGPRSIHAQAVSVTPDGGNLTGTGGAATFVITNNLNIDETFDLFCGVGGAVTACEAPPAVQVQRGGSVSVDVTYSTGAGASGTLSLSAAGEISGEGDDGWYDVEVGSAGVAVTPDGATAPARAANTAGYSGTFTVTNTGPDPMTFSFVCGGAGGVFCGTVPSPVNLSAFGVDGYVTTVSMAYSVGGPGTGTLTLTASGGGVSDPGSYTVPIVSNSVSVIPDGSTAPIRTANTGGYSEPFTVTNTGSASNTFTFTCGGAGVSCGTVPGPATLAGNGGNTTISMPYSTGTAGTGTLTLTATGGGVTDIGSYSVPVISFVPAYVNGSGVVTKDTRYILQETANTYNTHGEITQFTDARSQVTNYVWSTTPNDAFLMSITRVHDATGSINLVTNIGYDTDGFVRSIQDEGGAIKYFAYDLYGRLRVIQNSNQDTVRAYGYTYSRTGPNWTFDPQHPNWIVDTTFIQKSPRTFVETRSYLGGLGSVVQTVVRDGTSSSSYVGATQYDLMGRTWRVWKPYLQGTFGFDPNFASTATAAYNGYHTPSTTVPYVETTYTADALGRVKQVTPEHLVGAPNAVVTRAYGIDVSNPSFKRPYVEVTDESGHKTRTLTDLFGNTVQSVLGYGSTDVTTTVFTVNSTGQRTQATDPRGLITTYSLDTRGLQTSRTSPDAGTVNAKYDKAGNIRFTQDANQATATPSPLVSFTTYDFAGRPLRSGLGAAAFSALNPDITEAVENDANCPTNCLIARQYDTKPPIGVFPWSRFSAQITPSLQMSNVAGRLAAVASKSNNAWQVTLFSYDVDGRIARRYIFTEANGGASGVLTAINTTIAYTRDLRDAIVQRAETIGTGMFFYQWYDYDGRGLLSKAYDSTLNFKPLVPDVIDTYRPSGLPQDYLFKRTSGTAVAVPIRYTIREQVQKIGDPAACTFAFCARYAYQLNGAVDTAEFYNGGLTSNQRYRYAFGPNTANTGYDALNRVKSADYSYWSGTAWVGTPAYDLVGIIYDLSGNIKNLQRQNQSGSALVDNLTYNYVAGTNRLASLTEAAGVTSEPWDAEAGTFTYDANGNLKTAPGPYLITSVTYDPSNLPLSITRNPGTSTTTTYRYDDAGQRIAKQKDALPVEIYLREGGSVLGVFTMIGNTVSSSYFNLLWNDRVVGRRVGNTLTYYHFDPLGSVRAVTSGADAAVTESQDFDPWGLPMAGRALVSASPAKEKFSGKEQDAETGLDYFGARYYMAAVGRWAAVDPSADETPEWSPFVYVFDNPIVQTDPDGRQVVNVKKTNAFWEDVAVEGHQQGGLVGGLKVAAGVAALTVIDYGGLNAMDEGTDKIAYADNASDVVSGVIETTLGAASMMPIPGGKVAEPLGEIGSHVDDAARGAEQLTPKPRVPGPTVDPGTGEKVGRFVVDSKGNAMIEPAGGRTVPAGPGGRDTHTLYPNGSNAQRLNPQGHPGNPTPHGHGHLPGTGPGRRGQGPSTTPTGKVVPSNSPDAHWKIKQ